MAKLSSFTKQQKGTRLLHGSGTTYNEAGKNIASLSQIAADSSCLPFKMAGSIRIHHLKSEQLQSPIRVAPDTLIIGTVNIEALKPLIPVGSLLVRYRELLVSQ